ncbi:MAG: class I tRNA ligase family protein [Alistipes putredinis]|nr:MAG: class I tRNA ligase family protein [Alistipes putredinis]
MRSTTSRRWPSLPRIKAAVEDAIENYRFREALREAMNMARLGNKYLADTEPWKVVKTDKDRVATILNVALQITANLAIVIEPFMPFHGGKDARHAIRRQTRLGNAGTLRHPASRAQKSVRAACCSRKIEDSVIEAQLKKTRRCQGRQSGCGENGRAAEIRRLVRRIRTHGHPRRNDYVGRKDAEDQKACCI